MEDCYQNGLSCPQGRFSRSCGAHQAYRDQDRDGNSVCLNPLNAHCWLTPWGMAVFQTYLSFRAEREVFFDIPSTRKLQVKISRFVRCFAAAGLLWLNPRRMKTILIVFHSNTGGTYQMAEAAAKGAASEPEIGIDFTHAADAGPSNLLQSSAYIFATPENLAMMSGVMKHFFDRTYYPVLDRIVGRPYATLVVPVATEKTPPGKFTGSPQDGA